MGAGVATLLSSAEGDEVDVESWSPIAALEGGADASSVGFNVFDGRGLDLPLPPPILAPPVATCEAMAGKSTTRDKSKLDCCDN